MTDRPGALAARSVSVVVPIYNEHELCEPALHEIHAFFSDCAIPFEIIVIESGSTDGTDDICRRVAQQLTNLRVIHEGQRNGMGAALRLGYQECRMDTVLLVTVDLPFALDTFRRAAPLMQDHDCVLSYRSDDNRNALRKVQSWVYSTLVRRMLGLRMRSINSAFKLLPRAFVQSLPLISKGWFLDAEILYWISQRGLRYAEIPVALVDRTAGQSSVTAADWIKTLHELHRFRATLRRTSHE